MESIVYSKSETFGFVVRSFYEAAVLFKAVGRTSTGIKSIDDKDFSRIGFR